MQAEQTIEVNKWLWRYGYPWAPSVLKIKDLTLGLDGPLQPDGDTRPCPDSVANLADDDPLRIEMLRLAQMMMESYGDIGITMLGRSPIADGHDGPVTQEMIVSERCGCPDFGPLRIDQNIIMEVGSGPWKRCHGVGEFHAAHIRFTNSPPAHLNTAHPSGRTCFQEALRLTRESYREIGLMLYFSGPGVGDELLPKDQNVVQSNASFVSSAPGWIGLAIVGNNGMSCTSSPIWARFLQGFASSSNPTSKTHAWHLLLAHEFGHNCGLSHTSGGIMNPSLNTAASGKWIGDVAESWMKGRFGGVAVPTPGPKPDPEPDDETWWHWIVRKFFGG